MTAKGKFAQSLSSGITSRVSKLTRRISALEGAGTRDDDLVDAEGAVVFDVGGMQASVGVTLDAGGAISSTEVLTVGTEGINLPRGSTNKYAVKWNSGGTLTGQVKNYVDTYDGVQTNVGELSCISGLPSDGRHVMYVQTGWPGGTAVPSIVWDTGDGGAGTPAHPQAQIQINSRCEDVDTFIFGTAGLGAPVFKVDASANMVYINGVAYSGGPMFSDTAPHAIDGDATEKDMASFTIPANLFYVGSTNHGIRVKMMLEFYQEGSGTTRTNTITWYWGGAAIFSKASAPITINTKTVIYHELTIMGQGATNVQRARLNAIEDNNTADTATLSAVTVNSSSHNGATVDTTASAALKFTCQHSNNNAAIHTRMLYCTVEYI